MAKKFKERDEFEIHALLLEGEITGFARCTLERCKERMKSEQKKVVFSVQQQHREGMLKRYMHRHLEYYHMTEEEFEQHKLNKRKTQGRSKSRESQMSIMNYVQEPKTNSLRKVLKKMRFDSTRAHKTKLSHQNSKSHTVIEKMKILNAAAIASNDLSLNVLVSKEFMERDKFLLESLGANPDLAHKFNRGATAVKMDLFKNGREQANLIRATIPKLAELSRVAILIDHQSILQLTNEPARDSIGVALVLSATDEMRYCHLIGFEAVSSTTTAETVRTTKSILKEMLDNVQFLVYNQCTIKLRSLELRFSICRTVKLRNFLELSLT